MTGKIRPTGHAQVKGKRGARRYYAMWRDAEGRHQKALGPAHVKDSGRRTARGAVIWRAADGAKPDATYLTPADAEGTLREILAAAPTTGPAQASEADIAFGDACEEWLRYVEREKKRAPSTVYGYRNDVRSTLLPAFGSATPVTEITTAKIDDWREQLLEDGHLSDRTVQKLQTYLHGILKRAKRKGWIDSNPAEDAERVSVKRSGDFNVLRPEEVVAVARAAQNEIDAAAFVVAAFTGLRMGELRALRWRDVEYDKRLLHVRRSYSAAGFGRPKSQKVRSVPLPEQALEAIHHLSRRENFTSPDDLVLCSAVGTPLDDGALRKRFYAALARAGLGHLREKADPLVFHDLRHTFGTLAVQAFPLSDVKAYMGHADIETTMVYVHHVPRVDAADRLSRLLDGSAARDEVAR